MLSRRVRLGHLNVSVDEPVEPCEEKQMTEGSPENLSANSDHVLLECSPWSQDYPEDAGRDDGVDCD